MTHDVKYAINLYVFRIHNFIQNGKKYICLRLVENYRVNGKTKQRVIASFGNISKLDKNEMKFLIKDLSKISSSKFKSLRKTKTVSGYKSKTTNTLRFSIKKQEYVYRHKAI